MNANQSGGIRDDCPERKTFDILFFKFLPWLIQKQGVSTSPFVNEE